MRNKRNKLPNRRIATTREIREWAEESLIRRHKSGIPFYVPPAMFSCETKRRTSVKRFYRVLRRNGFIQARQNGGIFVEGLAFKCEVPKCTR